MANNQKEALDFIKVVHKREGTTFVEELNLQDVLVEYAALKIKEHDADGLTATRMTHG